MAVTGCVGQVFRLRRRPVSRFCGCGRQASASVCVSLGRERTDIATFWCSRCLDGLRLDRVEAFLRLGGHSPVVIAVRAA